MVSALRGRLRDVLVAWERAVRRDVPRAFDFTPGELRDAMPAVLERLCQEMTDGGANWVAGLPRLTTEHGARRFHQHYTVPELLVEYRLLRQAIFEQAIGVAVGPTTAEVIALNNAVDAVCQGAVTAFADAQRAHVERAAEVKAKFLAFLAHDQRNHLNHALLLLELHTVEVAHHPDLARSVKDLREVREAIRQTTCGMERLMHAERLRRGTVEPVRQPVRPAALVRSIIGGFAAEASGKGIRVEPTGPEEGELQGDPALLGLVLTNLIGNAIKFSAAGVVRVTADRAGPEAWRFAVADEGPGIEGGQVERLFDAFVRGETHGQGGMGLGLSIASQAARLMGGRLTMESTVGAGSTFTLVVPDVLPPDVPPRA